MDTRNGPKRCMAHPARPLAAPDLETRGNRKHIEEGYQARSVVLEGIVPSMPPDPKSGLKERRPKTKGESLFNGMSPDTARHRTTQDVYAPDDSSIAQGHARITASHRRSNRTL